MRIFFVVLAYVVGFVAVVGTMTGVSVHNFVSDCHGNGGTVYTSEWHGIPHGVITCTYAAPGTGVFAANN